MSRQITTPSRLLIAQRNAAVVAGRIPCQAIDCQNQATRWSNLCGKCERQFLEDMKPVFGHPSKEELAVSQSILRSHYAREIASGVFDGWSSQIGRAFKRPLSLLRPPLAMKRLATPRERFVPLLAMRTRDRGVLTRKGVINNLAYALAFDALFTPTIPPPVRKEYMIAFLGQKFLGRGVYSRTVVRYRSRREKTGVIRYGPDGPQELTRLIEEEVPTKEYFRIRRADFRFIGRQLWKTMEKMLLVGGREGSIWQELQDELRRRLVDDDRR
jgi:hypothetical protein